MNDKEFDKCNRKLKQLLKKDKYRVTDFVEILQWAFRQGYDFALEQGESK